MQWIRVWWAKNVTIPNKIRTIEQFNQLASIPSSHYLTRDDLSTILRLFNFLTDEYPRNLLGSFLAAREIEVPRPNLEEAIRDLRSLNRFIDDKELIPPMTTGFWLIPLPDFFIDEKGRYIPYNSLFDFFDEIKLLISKLLEQDFESDNTAIHNLRQVSVTIHLHAMLGLVLCDEVKKTLTQ